MITKVTISPLFIKETKKLDKTLLEKLKKQIMKIIKNPHAGKPLKYKKNERTIYVKPFRLIYTTNKDELILLKFEHRKNAYNY